PFAHASGSEANAAAIGARDSPASAYNLSLAGSSAAIGPLIRMGQGLAPIQQPVPPPAGSVPDATACDGFGCALFSGARCHPTGPGEEVLRHKSCRVRCLWKSHGP